MDLTTHIFYTFENSPLGKMIVAATDRGICFLSIGESEAELFSALELEFPKAVISLGPNAHLRKCVMELSQFFKQETGSFDLTLDPSGTDFQLKVWQTLQKIPKGRTLTYTEVAKEIGRPKAIRAVASACARNKIAILIPCHRVVREGGALAGYRWGLQRKKNLLELECSRDPEKEEGEDELPLLLPTINVGL